MYEEYEAEMKAVNEAGTMQQRHLETIISRVEGLKDALKLESQGVSEGLQQITQRIDDQNLIQANMIGSVLLSQFIKSPIDAENEDLMRNGIFEYSSSLSPAHKEFLQAQKKILNHELENATCTLKNKLLLIEQLKQRRKDHQLYEQYWRQFTTRLLKRLSKFVISAQLLVYSQAIMARDLEQLVAKELGAFAERYVALDTESLLIYEALNAKKFAKKMRLKNMKEILNNSALLYSRMVFSNMRDFEAVEEFVVLKFADRSEYNTWIYTLDSLCKNMIINKSTITKSDQEVRQDMVKMTACADFSELKRKDKYDPLETANLNMDHFKQLRRYESDLEEETRLLRKKEQVSIYRVIYK